MIGHVHALSLSRDHRFSKDRVRRVEIVAGHGVAGDAHAGTTVQHLSRMRADPAQPNLRQVHLIHDELLQCLGSAGFAIGPGDLGENITTSGIDLLALPTGTLLRIGGAVLEVTGLRNPCAQIESFRPGLLKQVARRRPDGSIERLAGIMAIAREGGSIEVGDAIAVHLPPPPYRALAPV